MRGRRALIAAAGAALALPALTIPALAAPRGKKPEFQGVVAETSRGRVRGVNNDGIRTFKGIPYAASTEGVNRFRAPKPATPWKGIRDTLATTTDPSRRARLALYLALSSAQYQIQN